MKGPSTVTPFLFFFIIYFYSTSNVPLRLKTKSKVNYSKLYKIVTMLGCLKFSKSRSKGSSENELSYIPVFSNIFQVEGAKVMKVPYSHFSAAK